MRALRRERVEAALSGTGRNGQEEGNVRVVGQGGKGVSEGRRGRGKILSPTADLVVPPVVGGVVVSSVGTRGAVVASEVVAAASPVAAIASSSWGSPVAAGAGTATSSRSRHAAR